MRIFVKVIKNICLGIFGIYSINVIFNTLNINIPINVFTILMSSFLGLYGIITLLIIKLII